MTDGPSDSIKRLLAAIGYPERTSGESSAFTLRVDGMEVLAEEVGDRLVLSYALSGDDSLLPTLASYAGGRMLREDAVLAYGQGSAFLWQDAPADAGSSEMTRLFETFMNSCEWWRDRVDSLRGGGGAQTSPAPEAMVIRP